MTRFFSSRHKSLVPYTPGEQPRDMAYIKLNTNESPFPPSESVVSAVAEEVKKVRLYSDPTCKETIEAVALRYGVSPSMVVLSNGSDEILNFAVMAYCDKDHPLVFPNITYGFYPVFCEINGVPYEEIPLKSDFSIDVSDYIGIGKNIVIANPNAPTGMALPLSDIEKIVASNPDNIVIIDEAYVDFGAESAVKLVHKYDNLIVTQTFSKSRSMAGARLGFSISSPAIASELHTIRYSTNPYNVNRMTLVAGKAALESDGYYMENCRRIEENRAYTRERLEAMGFTVLPSKANFLFAKSDSIAGGTLYAELKRRGVLVRHFDKPLIADYNRITVGTREEMDIFLARTQEILEEIQ